MKSKPQTARKDFKIPAGIFVFAVILALVMGYFAWRAADYPVPSFWRGGISEAEGIWKDDGPLQKAEKWRIDRLIQDRISQAKKLELEGTVWETTHPPGIFFEFRNEDIILIRSESPIDADIEFEVSGSTYKFLPSSGHLLLAASDWSVTPNLFFYEGNELIEEGSLGYDDGKLTLWIFRDGSFGAIFMDMTRVPPNTKLPPAIKPATLSP